MCFRPAAVEIKKTCPACGEESDSAAEVCARCGATLPASVFGAPGAPGSPGVPGAPGKPVPAAPPGAPKAPGVSEAPE